MLKVAVLADREAWCFASRAKALRKYAPPDIQISVIPSDQVYAGYIAWQSYDLVFLLNTAVIDNLRRHFRLCGIKVPIVASHNSGLFRRDDMLRKALDNAEFVVVNNYATYANLLISTHGRQNFCNISNGVDLDTFYVETPIEERPHKFLWAGSQEKWDDPGDVKGARRVLAPLKHYLDENEWRLIVGLPWQDPGISLEYLIVDPKGPAKNSDEMRAFYNSGSYILCPSLSEGTPNIVLEAMACGCVPVCGPVGNLPELYPGYDWAMPRASTTTVEGVPMATAQDYWETMLALPPKRAEMAQDALRAIQPWDWSVRSEEFYRLFRAVAAGQCPEPFSWIDNDCDRWIYAEHYAPEFVASTQAKLDAIGSLPPNWDAQGASVIAPAIISAAKEFIATLPENLATCPAVVPMAKGNLQFEWHDGPRTLELEFEDASTVHYLKWNPPEGIEEEDYFSVDDIATAETLIRWFMRGVTNV